MPGHLQSLILLCLGLTFCVSLLVVLAQKLKIAYPVFLVLAGLLVSFVPAIPAIHIDPELVFLVILPPILFDAAQNMSLKALWKWRRIISVLALGYVLATATAVAFVSHWLIPGFTLSQGFLLGAIISPPDAAAAVSVLKFTKLPKGVVSVLEGESLLNDATSLTLFRFALAAITTHQFVWYEAVTGFSLVVVSGIGIGLAFGLLSYAIYKWLPTNANLDVAFSIVLPYLMYITAEAVHSSGVLAVVSGGLFIAYQIHFVFPHQSRLKAAALWSSVVFILNAVVFFLIGLQLNEITGSIQNMSIWTALNYALVVTIVVIVVRMISGFTSTVFTRYISRFIRVAQSRPGWRNPVVAGWVGMRGVVSLASASAIPLLLPNGQPFPNRPLFLFITFVVIIVTLVGQGLTLPWVIRRVKPKELADAKSDDQQRLEIDLALYKAAFEELQSVYQADIEKSVLLQHRVQFIKHKLHLLKEANSDDGTRQQAILLLGHFQKIMLNVTEQERKKLHSFRRLPDYDDDVIRLVEHRLDLEEELLEGDGE
ncbi:Na+/H+ antiporter [Spirosoma endbachense]|uniref:Na+/H+ antiporter n=1 Tax=Spirosoma endbachense TaxID=2666025 RepID=A0A6P1W3C5_9BACT|nr:Na+/H+ antiporter [Spirosoma endbachense]QHV98509.1 Na+/H+ antiporter [Spirosoma endbachense]